MSTEEQELANNNEDKEELFVEITTVPDPETIDILFPKKYFKKSCKPFDHQGKTVRLCADAEACKGVQTEIYNPDTGVLQGSALCRSRIGGIANNTGAGKCLTALALACCDIEVEPEVFSYSSSLVDVTITPNEQRQVLPFSIILCPKTIVNHWKKNAEDFMKEEYYKVFESKARLLQLIAAFDLPDDFEIGHTTPLELDYWKSYNDMKDMKVEIKKLNKIFKQEKDEDKAEELEAQLEEKMRHYKYCENNCSSIIEKFKVDDFLKVTMEGKKVLICSAEAFYILFPMLIKYRIQRLFIDEPQLILITNQIQFRDSSFNECLDFLFNPKALSRSPYRENSPACFTWLISATIHQAIENESSGKKTKTPRYINTWIGRNAPFLRDYVNSVNKQYRMPELVKKYIIKFSRSYVMEQMFKGKKLYVRYNIKVKRSIQAVAVEGVFEGNEQNIITDLINNDDSEGLCNYFGIESIEDLSDGIIKKLKYKIDDMKDKIKNTKLVGDGKENYVAKLKDAIAVINSKIKNIEMKQEKLNPREGESLECIICREDVKIDKEPNVEDKEKKNALLKEHGTLICSVCATVYHCKCLLDYLQITNKKDCCMCRADLEKTKPCFLFKQTKNSRNIDDSFTDFLKEEKEELGSKKKGKKEKEEEKRIDKLTFDDKLEAFQECLEYSGDKLLVFTNFSTKGDSQVDSQLVRYMIDNGYKVVIPRSKTKAELDANYGSEYTPYISMIRTQKDTPIMLDKFRQTSEKTAWILESGVTSAGLDFEFVDTIICYSNFASMTQIIGRGLRIGRNKKFRVFVLCYESQNESETRVQNAKSDSEDSEED